jgi:oligo-alginate lyase
VRTCKFVLLLALAGSSPAADLPPHPRLLFNAGGIAALKKRVQDPAWSARWKTFQAAIDRALAAPLQLPPRGVNWWHWYVCPRHGARLTTGKSLGPWQWEHICPVDREVLRSDPSRPDRDYDGVVMNNAVSGHAHAIQGAGILFQVTGEERYAKAAREILLAYAGRYLSYTLHNTNGQERVGGGRLTPQTLDESVWLIPVAQGADLIWDTLSEADRQTLAEKLFLPAARDVILPHQMGIHNIQCWKNSAVGLAGFLLGDQALIDAAIDNPDRGYRAQMAKGVQGDGAWFEGAWGYHFYTLSALWPLAEAARNNGIDLYGEPLKKMFEAPIRLSMPDLMLPAFNDSAETPVRNNLYELAYARYRDPLYLAALEGSGRRGDYALWFGVDRLPAEAPPALGSRNSTESGYAILQSGSGPSATWLCLKYGPHGGGHGHPDKNNFILYANGRVLYPDPGTRPYGSPLHTEWDRVTLAHNTLVVDGKSQAPATGRSLAFGSDNGIDYAMTDAGNIYEGVRFVRTAVLLDRSLVLFIDRATADHEHTFDLVNHLAGRWLGLPAGEPAALPSGEGYQHLKDAANRQVAGTELHLEADGKPGAIFLAGNEPTGLITATGVGASTEERIPVAIFRRTGRQATWVWAAELTGTPVKLTVSGDGSSAVVRVERGGRQWDVAADFEKASLRVRPTATPVDRVP